MRHARGAVPRLARERRAETAAARGFEHGVAGLIADGVFASLEPDHEFVRRRAACLDGYILGYDEAFDEHLARLDADPRQAGLDRVHVRTGTADIEVGVGLVAGQRRALLRVEEAALRIEVMMHRQPVAVRRREPLELAGEDHRVPTAIRVHERDGSTRRRERALDDGDHRGDTAATRECDDRCVRRPQHEQARRAHHLDRVARRERVVHPVRHSAGRNALDRGGEAVAGVGGTRHGVRTHDRLAVDRRAERAELAGGVRERRRELAWDVEDERPGVGGLVDDCGHGEAVVLVVGRHRRCSRVGVSAMITTLSSFASVVLTVRRRGMQVGETERAGRWPVRTVPADLRERYEARGWWTDETLGGLVDRCLGAAPTATVNVWSESRPWHGTYAEVLADARRLVAALADAGLEPGDVVAFQLPNWREAVVAFYGLALGGYVLVPIVHIYGRKEVRFILGESHARAYISADRYGHVDYLEIVDGTGADEIPDLELHVVVGAHAPSTRAHVRRVGWEIVDAAAPTIDIGCADCDDVCVLAYTSGTTSEPKGVMHSHRTLLAELVHMRAWITPGHPNLMGSPVTHATGMLGAVLAPMEMGQDIHLIDRWDPGRVLQVMLDADVGAGTGASVFLASILDDPGFTPEHARRIRRVGLGGAPVPVALAERAAAHGIALVRAYGSTEHPSVTGCGFDDPAGKRHGTDGSPMAGVEIRLLGDGGSPVAPGEPGEIWSRWPDLCLGYTDAALTDEAFDADGWYRSGDMGVVDAEGFLTITDRVNDVIIRGGENLSAAEIEEAVAGLPQVAEVAVVAAPDERFGEHACRDRPARVRSGGTGTRRRHRRARSDRSGPPEVARRAAHRRRLPAHTGRQDPQGGSPPAVARRRPPTQR